MYAMSSKPRTVQQLLESTLRLYRHTFQSVLPLTLIAVVSSIIQNQFTLTHTMPENPGEWFRVPGYTLTMIASTLVLLYAYAALFAKLDFLARAEPMTSVRAFAIGLRALPTFSFATLLFLLATFIGLLLLIVPGVFVSVALCLYGPVVMLEGKGAIASLQASHELVRGSWWYIAVVQLAGVLPVLLLATIVLIIADLALAPLAGSARGKLVVGLVMSGIFTGAATPFFAALVLESYYEMKIRRVGAPAPGS